MIEKQRKTRAQLVREVEELQAQLASTYHFATAGLHKAGGGGKTGGAFILRITALGGRELIPPTAICGGFSQNTIDAIRADMVRSYEYATEFKPVLRKV